jgi:hypothetical protein
VYQKDATGFIITLPVSDTISGGIMIKEKEQPSSVGDAEFLGWQETSRKPFALFNITHPEHPARGSTVSEETLRELNLDIPKIPLIQLCIKIMLSILGPFRK